MQAPSRSLNLPPEADATPIQRLGRVKRGFRGFVAQVGDPQDNGASFDLERRLLEIGFVEGASIAVLHEGPIRGDPIAVRVGEAMVALRRAEADFIFVTADD